MMKQAALVIKLFRIWIAKVNNQYKYNINNTNRNNNYNLNNLYALFAIKRLNVEGIILYLINTLTDV